MCVMCIHVHTHTHTHTHTPRPATCACAHTNLHAHTRHTQGSFDNLRLIRQAGVTCPLLCKEFVVEAYQVFKARAR